MPHTCPSVPHLLRSSKRIAALWRFSCTSAGEIFISRYTPPIRWCRPQMAAVMATTRNYFYRLLRNPLIFCFTVAVVLHVKNNLFDAYICRSVCLIWHFFAWHLPFLYFLLFLLFFKFLFFVFFAFPTATNEFALLWFLLHWLFWPSFIYLFIFAFSVIGHTKRPLRNILVTPAQHISFTPLGLPQFNFLQILI